MKALRFFLAVLLSGCMLLSFFACAREDADNPPPIDDTSDDSTADSTADSTGDSEAEADAKALLNTDLTEPFYLMKGGKPTCYIVYEGSASDDNQAARAQFVARIRELCGGAPYQLSSIGVTDEETFPLVLFGNTGLSDASLMGEATAYQYVLARSGNRLHILSHTPGGRLDAMETLKNALTVSEDGQDVYIPVEVFGVYDRDLEETQHAFDTFTISYYGPPSFSAYDPALWNEMDQMTFENILAFGADIVPVYAWGVTEEADIAAVRAMVEKFHENGLDVRLYALSETDADEAEVQRVVEAYGDLDGVAQWGYYDEPLGTEKYEICRSVMEAFDRYDEKQRPVYINMGPVARADFCHGENEYNNLAKIANPDYYCFDRYPFFLTDTGEAAMTDTGYYSNLEMNRAYAIDNSRDAGIIVQSVRYGGGTFDNIADITQDFMDWQINLALAYGYRYVEHYFFYYQMEEADGSRNSRYTIAQTANRYAQVVGTMLADKQLDAVFHLPNESGGYSLDVTPYYGYREIGDITGCDAVLSFFDDGTIIVTDKRCCDADGGEHDVTFTALPGTAEWFNPDSGAWEDISGCPDATVGNGTLTLTLSRASQRILRLS